MICTAKEYAVYISTDKKKVSGRTIRRRCELGLLPSNHKARQLPTKQWVIEVLEKN